jgi:predicted metalloprotease
MSRIRIVALAAVLSCTALLLAQPASVSAAPKPFESLVQRLADEIDGYWSGDSFFWPSSYVYASPRVELFDVSIDACGATLPPREGSLYCARNETIYLDGASLRAFQATGGDVAVGVVMAYHWGHHVQQAFGLSQADAPSRPGELSTVVWQRQAACLAGVWGRAFVDDGGAAPAELNSAVARLYSDDSQGGTAFWHGYDSASISGCGVNLS